MGHDVQRPEVAGETGPGVAVEQVRGDPVPRRLEPHHVGEDRLLERRARVPDAEVLDELGLHWQAGHGPQQEVVEVPGDVLGDELDGVPAVDVDLVGVGERHDVEIVRPPCLRLIG